MRILFLLQSDALKPALTMAVRGVVSDAQISHVKDIESAISELQKQNQYMFIFIQHGFPQKEIIHVINSASKNKAQKPRIILVVREDDSDEEMLSMHLSMGFSGMLVEPFSFDATKDVMKLSDCLTMAGSVARLTVAAGLQIKAHLIGESKMPRGGTLLESVKQACQIFERENPGRTVKSVAQDISTLPTEERVKVNIKHIYTGVSNRVKQLVQKKNTSQY